MNNTLTEEQELMLVYEVLLDAAKTVNNDPNLSQFRDSANQDLSEFQENYPEICCEYEFQKKDNS